MVTDEDVALAITLTGTDPESDPLTFTVGTAPANGVLTGTAPNLTYTPNANFNGADSFTFTVSDGTVESAAATVSITVNAINDAPTAVGQTVVTDEDVALAITLTGSDVESDPLTFAVLTQPLNGSLSCTAADCTYTPGLDFNGADSFTFTVNDGTVDSAPATVSITVNAINDSPVVAVAILDQIAIEDAAFSLNVSGNFVDADGDPLTFAVSGLPASGNLVLNTVTGVISGTPRFADARDDDPYIVTVTATDNHADTVVPAQAQFELNISALNRANVSLNIAVAPDPAMLNDELSWTMTVRNTVGPQSAANVELVGSFVGSGLNISSASGCAIEVPVGQVSNFSCAIGTLPVGGSVSAVFTTVTSAAGDVVAFATAATTDVLPIDPNLADNSSQLAVGVAVAFSNGAVQELGNAEVRSIAAGDINGDGAVDLVVGTAAGQPIQIYLSGGFRDFATAPILLADTSANEGIALADFDRNGTLDLVVANGGGQADVVYSNQGNGTFTVMATLGVTFGQDVAVGDFNDDGMMDIVVATIADNPVYFGNGIGGFTRDATPLGSANSLAVAVGKFNNDDQDDIVFANAGSNSQIWIKNAGAGFSAGNIALVGDASSVVVGQFGGDERPDLAFGRVPSGIGDVPSNPVFINDGNGGFPSPFVVLGSSPTNDIHAGDVNSDGLTDLVFINASGVHQIWTATASGFELHREQIVEAGSTTGVLTELGMTDVGDPGGVDLAMGGAVVSGLGVFLNDGFGNLGRGDAVPPVLTLLGEASVQVPSGSLYSDSGASAVDNIDGNISRSVVVTSNVNTAIVGNYVVTYNVMDFAGNSATPITRAVSVIPAAGTGGGGGGGAVSLILLVLLILTACMSAYHACRAMIPAEALKQNRQVLEND